MFACWFGRAPDIHENKHRLIFIGIAGKRWTSYERLAQRTRERIFDLSDTMQVLYKFGPFFRTPIVSKSANIHAKTEKVRLNFRSLLGFF